MLFATICLAYTGGIRGLISTPTQPSYTSLLWAVLAIIGLILILYLMGKKGTVAWEWDEEDEDDQFYD